MTHHTHRIPIVGNSFREKQEQEFLSRLTEDPSLAPLSFEAEPDNPYDPYAIKVCCRVEDISIHLGYIPKTMTSIIHRAWQQHHIIEKTLIPNSNMMTVVIRSSEAPHSSEALHMPEYNPDPDAGDR